MGLANIIGLCLGAMFIFLSCTTNLTKIHQIWMFLDMPSVFVVIGGSVSAIFIGYPLKTIFSVHKTVLITFTAKERSPLKVIEQIVALSEAARREGLLSLENHMDEIDDNPLLAIGIRMAVDGMSPEVVESIMNIEIDSVNRRHNFCKSVLINFAKYAPAWGMLGTVIGLVIMLSDFSPDTVGAGMSVALITTFYGSIVANLFCLPWADKLNLISEEELMCMEITLRGVVAIQTGENPRIIKQKLLMYLPPSQRPVDTEEA